MTNRTEAPARSAALVLRLAVWNGDRARHAIDALTNISRIVSRAMLAAHTYEMLRTRFEEDLARKGLARMDLPRAAYIVLTKES